MTSSIEMPDPQPGNPLAYLVLHDGGVERGVPIIDQLFIGRECAGISESRRLVIRDPEISRTHLEIRLDAVADQAFVIDTSTNGTLLNGMRLARAVPAPLRPGDEIRIADAAMVFRSQRFTAAAMAPGVTRTRISQTAMVMVVGDIINYSTISEVTEGEVIAQSLHTLWHEIGGVLQAHRGTLNHYAGDAIFAIWEASQFPDAGERAIDFALAANQLVGELGPRLPLRSPDGSPIRMGWGVVVGMVALAAMTRSVEAVIGDSTNVAFRLAGLAGRQGRASVMVTNGVRRTVETQFTWGEGEQVELKGRSGKETVFPVIGRGPATGSTTLPGRNTAADPGDSPETTAEMPIRKAD
ncbi:adenylate/guanylate cyclase domain-containing protein [Mycobacterium sp. Aquia_213]|uniref:adenylate/guanylate cyclase domain-containing protein n=1 Tax=Mycobacterium sp. Aquia_213 TaxID=2991728 RepID=UPI00226E31FF|nr:adenylate/guanylate cyclase domain-containing protein [Mycobacterium sp. Aquia_213]WAC89220.1 adenylate/guanylate cyclase domain-containing protein [Mycobacterium sp. Aquia_213]